MNQKEASLIVASTENDSNLYYACHFLVPDPIIFFESDRKKYLVVNDLEYDRAKMQAKVDRIISLSNVVRKLKKKIPRPHQGHVIDFLFRERKIRRISVPSNFPASYYISLKRLGYSITIKPEPFFEGRLVKTDQEKKYITSTLRRMEDTLDEILKMLGGSRIRGNRIYLGKEVVTSELLRSEIDRRLMERGCVTSSTIVASGVQGSFPHHEGHGPIRPHTPIIFDIFPRDKTTRYWGDMTRTVVKGKPSDEVKKMFQAVLEANQRGTEMLTPGLHSSKVHSMVVDLLTQKGFKTGKTNSGRMEGFIHGTGHGLGLDIHEPPSISPHGSVLKKGNVVTIEPGLYYQKHGGMRLEDVAYVGEHDAELLTRYPKFLELDRA